jgi:hypothetical protein
MGLKKCSGCARAIVESANSCDYCGQRDTAPIVHAPGVDDPEAIEVFPAEVPPDPSTPQIPQVALSFEAAEPAEPEIDSVQWQSSGSETTVEGVSEAGTIVELAPARVTSTPVVDTLTVDSRTTDDSEDSREFLVQELPRFDVAGESGSPHMPPPDTIAQPAPTRIGPRELMTGLVGVVGGAFLIFALMSTRGAAAPEAAPAVAHAPKPQQSAVAPAVVTPKWSSNPTAWVGGERHSAAFELAAINKVQVWMRQVRPMLVVRCRASVAEVFVFTDSPARMEPQDGNHSVRIRLDSNPEVAERWPDSAEHDALFAPDGGAFLRQLVRAQRLEFGFSPHNASPTAASFDVTGLIEHLAAAAKQCGWKNP